ncbi:zinc resistance-associated protein [Pseudodesulfovibrio mercurii]|uniref:Zinc resistance-associated protein n=1 Tax=Pseudodesulfovibrio mercurii TaxID=641491 RepID=F0JFF6_9BACT|nr:Spy/CpxP family protein refolding chaperone [Pseudodesulfovibrio mercurii]EGB14880.1 zinc resistance-associated protein [Pseudodesulfovibrio mercurii]
MSKKQVSISALAAVLVLSMAAFAVAGPGQGRGYNGVCQGFGPGSGPGAAYSQLTPEKQAEVKAVFDKYEPQFEAVRNQMWAKRSVLQAMVNGGNADEKAITKLVNDISEQRNKMRDLRVAMSDELVKTTGIAAFGTCPGPGYGRGFDADDGPGQGRGMYGRGMGRGMY